MFDRKFLNAPLRSRSEVMKSLGQRLGTPRGHTQTTIYKDQLVPGSRSGTVLLQRFTRSYGGTSITRSSYTTGMDVTLRIGRPTSKVLLSCLWGLLSSDTACTWYLILYLYCTDPQDLKCAIPFSMPHSGLLNWLLLKPARG